MFKIDLRLFLKSYIAEKYGLANKKILQCLWIKNKNHLMVSNYTKKDFFYDINKIIWSLYIFCYKKILNF